ncbi:HAD family hydrolase (plasmid) [Azospirillum baldaniorum]|uniref:Haloacid dehalogenase domain protein hydrolase n=1 Tax=Azospirillum baldaniorum TaxID=1064539 RepID=A0A9P1K1S4_9PROT|nr:HAD family hydrolase [Azospirillum baldaniorum]AWJ93488.1 HAD family hydrolase [Azospirillum baldaniorum]TWA71720.1 putative hydrolase of the HAD superfamily [Azospirillum brasilense]CCD03954.1 putative Haloacid dehalogenase domain protein hydrolase [Azospirillum baldaniorum]
MTLSFTRPEAFATPPEAIVFDTDNNLYAYDPAHAEATEAAERKACKLFGLSRKEFHDAFTVARREVKDRLGKTAGSHSRLLYFQRTIELLGMKTQLLATLDIEQTYWRTFLHASTLFPDVKEFLLDLRSLGIKTAIVTDLTAQIQFRKIIYFGLDDYFDYVVTSEEAGHDKPHAAPFQLAVDKLGVPPQRCWMIGDNPVADVQGGRAFGMITLQKRHAGVKIAEGDQAADAVFDEFGELRRLFVQRGWMKPVPDGTPHGLPETPIMQTGGRSQLADAERLPHS